MASEYTRNVTASFTRFEKQLGDKWALGVKKIALETFTGIVKKTPVDTGAAVGGWVPGLDRDPAFNNILDPGRAQVLARGQAVLSQITENTKKVIFLNNIIYITQLEGGRSRQASSGMVRLTLYAIKAKYGGFFGNLGGDLGSEHYDPNPRGR